MARTNFTQYSRNPVGEHAKMSTFYSLLCCDHVKMQVIRKAFEYGYVCDELVKNNLTFIIEKHDVFRKVAIYFLMVEPARAINFKVHANHRFLRGTKVAEEVQRAWEAEYPDYVRPICVWFRYSFLIV